MWPPKREQASGSMNSDPINTIHTSKQSTKERLKNNLKGILDQANQSIYGNKYENPTVTLTTTFDKPTGEANQYLRFGYVPEKSF